MEKQETIDFLKEVVRTRRRLIKKGISKKSQRATERATDFIERHLEYNEKRWTKLGLARFFCRHQDQIRMIIPGELSGSHRALMKKFHRISFLCETETGMAEIDAS